MGRGTSAECTTSRMARSSKAPHSWEVFHNADRPTSRWDDHAHSPGSFALVYPRPAIPRPCSYPAESALDSPAPGLAKKAPDKCPDVGKCASQAFHTSCKTMWLLLFRM